MFCKQCGNKFQPEQKFCTNCGEKKEVNSDQTVVVPQPQQVNQNHIQLNNNQNINNNNQPKITNNHENNLYVNEQTLKELETPKKKNIIVVIIVVIIIFIVAIIALVGVLFINVSNSSNKLICQSKEGNITLMYNSQELIGYTTSGMKYDLDNQKKYASEIGINAYIEEFKNWFEKNTSGNCVKEEIGTTESTHEQSDNTSNENILEDTKVIGDNTFGFITVPDNWVKFYDVNGSTSLQYSRAGVYIVTLDYIKEKEYTAKEYASTYMYNMQQSQEVTGVTGATIKIGKNKEYTAYQVYMLYQKEGTYLVTYWFETEDGVVRYIGLEGPAELNGVKITDYLYIPESFSLSAN